MLEVQWMVILWFPFHNSGLTGGAGGAGGREKEETELSFNIPYHKSGLEKWLFFSRDHFMSSVWSVTRRPSRLTSENECVLFTHVCVCNWGGDVLMKEPQIGEENKEQMCEECSFFWNASWPESPSAVSSTFEYQKIDMNVKKKKLNHLNVPFFKLKPACR